MQQLYALSQAEKSDYQLTLDWIAEQFLPDLNSMKPQDRTKLEGLKKLTLLQFEELLKNKGADEEMPLQVQRVAREAVQRYKDLLRKDQHFCSKRLIEETEVIYNLYLKILMMIVEIGDEAKLSDERRWYDIDENEKNDSSTPTQYKTAIFSQNTVVEALRKYKPLETEAIRHSVTWDADRIMMRKFFRDVIKTNERFQSYCQSNVRSDEEDRKLVWFLIRNIILKNEVMESYFLEKDLNWAEDSDVVQGMLKRTFKILEEENKVELQQLSPSWEDDKYFYVDLFKKTIESDDQYETLIIQKIPNWDAERIALTDKILLKMALAEMIHFPSIPIKVTINEFIEVAKEYSTPKSGQFINGILDNLSSQLQKDGTIRKSGRGLIDTK
ncbi:MAG: transcription antitermination factor NusB [Spirosomataceae bacterium]